MTLRHVAPAIRSCHYDTRPELHELPVLDAGVTQEYTESLQLHKALRGELQTTFISTCFGEKMKSHVITKNHCADGPHRHHGGRGTHFQDVSWFIVNTEIQTLGLALIISQTQFLSVLLLNLSQA